MMKQYFSYRPRSGSRVFASLPTDHVAICDVRAGTIAVGDVVTLTLESAVPGGWYRDDARRAAAEVVHAVGGMAEDDQGGVTLVVPRHTVPRVLPTIRRLLGPCRASDLEAQLWRQAAAELVAIAVPDGGQFRLIEAPPIALDCVPGWMTRPQRDAAGDIVDDADGRIVYETVRALWIVDARWRGVQAGSHIGQPHYYVEGRRVGQPHYVEGRRVRHCDHIAVTDKGRHFRGFIGEQRYDTPAHDKQWVQIDPPHVDQARSLLPEPLPDGVEYWEGDEDSPPNIQAWRHAVDGTTFASLMRLASQVNHHASLPEWAGWESRELAVTAADAAT